MRCAKMRKKIRDYSGVSGLDFLSGFYLGFLLGFCLVFLSDFLSGFWLIFFAGFLVGVKGTEAGEVTAASAAVLMGKLGQYAAGAIYTDDGGVQHLHTAKVEALAEIVEAAQSPVLVFYRYRFEVDALGDRFKALGYRVRRCEGDADVTAWNAGEVDVLLAHPASVAYGLNMQAGGHYIVWTSPGWDLEQYLQANARLHRQGQRQTVHVYRLVARGTVDERAVAAIARKDGSQRAMLDALKMMSDID